MEKWRGSGEPAGAVLRLVPRPADPADGTDPRIRDLVSQAGWLSLPPAVRRRFSRPIARGMARLYRGRVIETVLPPAGRIIANLARLTGAPLPLHDGATGPASVTVTENPGLGGQVWTRVYASPGRLPQAIQSAKRFRGPTGIEEFLGPWRHLGLIMTLRVLVDGGALVFESAGYTLEVFGRRFRIPEFLAPGRCRITHRDLGAGRFTFTLDLVHPVFGLLCRQVAEFQDVQD